MDEITSGTNRALQRRADGRAQRLTAERRKLFLTELGTSCNVKRAAGAVGASQSAFYALRRSDEAFAAAWEEALATGYARLEAELLAAALEGETADVAVDRALALSLLGRRDAKARSGAPGGYGMISRTRHVPMADVEAALLRQLELLEKRLRSGKEA
ncbi:hypothetical protein [uncultured Sphingomonas sp.]|uniref:hypothetical protein n=1 Tax=uncultured Sphingomonas sp. TaxID=158754 RepID=UPI0035CA6FF4